MSYRFCWDITQSPGHSSQNDATVVMIDGVNLLSTPMSSLVIPPPMSANCFQTHASINQVTFHPSCRNIALLLSDGTLAVLKNTSQSIESGEKNNVDKSDFIQARVDLETNSELWSGPGCLHQLTWWKQNVLVSVGRYADGGGNVICEIRLNELDGRYEAKLK